MLLVNGRASFPLADASAILGAWAAVCIWLRVVGWLSVLTCSSSGTLGTGTVTPALDLLRLASDSTVAASRFKSRILASVFFYSNLRVGDVFLLHHGCIRQTNAFRFLQACVR